jgi:hypothetical protein
MSTNVVPIKTGSSLQPIMPTSFEECVRMSRAACAGGVLQKMQVGKYPNKREESDTELEMRGAMTIMQGLEVGLPPMQALQLIALINGKMTVHSEGIPALLWAKGFKIREWIEGEGDARVAHCEVTRPDGEKVERTFSVDDAKKAKLWSPNAEVSGYNGKKKANDSPWHKYDYRMLKARALGFAARDGAADALRGIWVREEVEDITRMKDVTPVEHSASDLPDFDAIPDSTPDEEPSEIDDAGGLLAAIKDDVSLANGNPEILAEISEQYGDLIERLPENLRGEAHELLESAQ